jgi:hypothetical protein
MKSTSRPTLPKGERGRRKKAAGVADRRSLHLSTLESRTARAQQHLRPFIKPGRSLSDELIAERRGRQI